MSNKSVLLLGNYPPPFGGVPTHIRYLSEFLSLRGWKVHIVSVEGNGLFRSRTLKIDGNITVYKPSTVSRWSSLLFTRWINTAEIGFHTDIFSLKVYLGAMTLAILARRIVQRKNITCIGAYHFFISGLACAWVSRKYRIPLIVSIFGEIYANLEFHKNHRSYVEYIVSTSTKMLSCSKHCAKSVELLNLPVVVEALYYGIDLKAFQPKKNLKDTDLPENKRRRVVFIGRLVREMGLAVLLTSIPEVLKVNRRIEFLIIGKSGEMLDDAITVQKTYPENVTVLPDVPFEALPSYYADSSFAIIPSINTRACLGLAIVEAMACGIPTIVSDVGGGREVVVDGKTGFLMKADDPADLTRAVLSAAELSDDVLAELGRNGRKRAVEMFDKEFTNIRMEQVLLESMGQNQYK